MAWLMLITEVPSKPDYLRVKLRRRVQRLGALGLKGAVYLLPAGPDSMEGFQWLRQEIVADGGEATICESSLIAGMTDAELTARFNQERDAEYGEFVASCDDLVHRWQLEEPSNRDGLVADRARLYTRLEEILGRDFFSAVRREEGMLAAEKLAVLDILAAESTGSSAAATYRNRVWVTRSGVKIDRIASAWLVRRVVDPAARFVFVADAKDAPENGIRFDMFDGEFTHQGGRCSFEVLLDHFDISDPALRIIGQIVHDIDLHEAVHARPETAGIAALIDGIVATVPRDEDRLREGAALFDRLVGGVR